MNSSQSDTLKRKISVIDRFVMRLDTILSSPAPKPDVDCPKRAYPAESFQENRLAPTRRQHVTGLMRVNHAGEIAAQALYNAQALVARDPAFKRTMRESAREEIDHLRWCEKRLYELGGHTSYLSPFWYAGSFGIGLIPGLFGDKWNAGFLAETEHQVVRHLDKHLLQLPKKDLRSRAILKKMREDELRHAIAAEAVGTRDLPFMVKCLMRLGAKIMTKTAYWI